MRYHYNTASSNIYRGWSINVSTDSNNNYTIRITPPYQMDYPSSGASALQKESFEKFRSAYEKHSYSFVYKDRFWKFFIAPLPNISKGLTAGKGYIDEHLGTFDFEKVFGFKKPYNLI